MMTEQFIRKCVQRILHEAGDDDNTPAARATAASKKSKDKKPKDKKKKKGGVKRGKVGRGGVKASVKAAGSRASEEPDKLMKDLGVSGGGGGDDIKQIYKVVSQAISGNEIMGNAYSGASGVESGGKQGVRVQAGDLSPRDAVFYMSHVLLGAQNAGMISLEEEWVVDIDGGGAIIHSGDKGGW